MPDPTVEGTCPDTGPMPERVVIGIGVRPDVPACRIVAAVRASAGDRVVVCLATLDRRATDPGIRAAATELGVPVRGYPAVELARVEVDYSSDRTAAAVGTPSVAEAAARRAGADEWGAGDIRCARTVIDGVVVALVRRRWAGQGA
ncbi:cobalamin biosynthesis protein [Nocardia rhizosphaerae]|uniref:Cobalamin biosynthesis protein n=1 Tax=Nocardia rhizosphaerae TaxID=1691571 RepID=A0ABV8L8W6_9NOCA